MDTADKKLVATLVPPLKVDFSNRKSDFGIEQCFVKNIVNKKQVIKYELYRQKVSTIQAMEILAHHGI